MKHRFRKLLAGVLTVAMLASALPAALAAEGEKHITILGTSDMHGNIWGYSYEDNKESANNGMARLYTYIQQVRAENPNTILIDGGDDIQGTIMTDDLYNKTPEEPHPVITAMNFMGYDAMTLGNHEFNWGIDTMKTITGQADFPVLAANVKDADGEFVTGAGWTIVDKGGVTVAVIGVVTPDVPIWDGGKQGVEACTYEAASTAVKAAIAAIGDPADVIVVSAHMGLYAEFDEENGSDSAQKILDDNPEIDVLQVAHNHVVVKDQQGSIVIGGARNGGRDIARFDLTLDADNNIVASTVEVVDMNGVTPSEEIRSIPLVAEAHQKTIGFIAGGTGEDGEKGEPLGVTTAKFQPANEIAGLPEGKLRDTAVMDLINRIQMENAQADVSAAALFKDTSDLPEGDINYGNIFDIYKFDNTLYRVTVTGAELKGYMEWAAECYNQWVPGDINISFDPEYPGYLYDMFAGVDYEINLSKPKGERIENVLFHGEPLTDDQTLTLAVNNYRYSSALKSQGLVSGKKEWESSNSIRDMIVAYFAEHSPVEPAVDNNWAITGVDLSLSDPRRQEIIDLVNAGRLDAPYAKSYNLNDYDAIIASALPAEEPAPWYAEAQAYVEEKGLMTGTPNGFEPEGTVTRATVFQTLWNMEGKPVAENTAAFPDAAGKWYADSAAWAYDSGLTTGDGTGAFAGDRSVTRAEIVTIFHRYAQLKGADVWVGEDTNILSYTDALSVAEWAVPAFQWACGAGVISGKDGGRLDPNGTATRAELAAILMKSEGPLTPCEYFERTVAIQVAENGTLPAHTIPGILTLPVGEGPFPAVVMLHGTGSNKNEAGGGYDLAAPAMAKAGIASLRIDFVGSGDSTASYADYCYTSANLDAKAAADYLAGLEAVDGDKIAVMGWSQGGTNALLAAAAFPETFHAVVTWSGALDLSGIFSDFDAAYAAARKNGSVELTFEWRDSLPVGLRWFEEVKAIDVLTETAKISAPVLAINGDLDDVVPMANAESIAETAQNGTLCIIEGADHTYNIFTGDTSAMEKTIQAGIDFLTEAFAAPAPLSMEEYLKSTEESWFLTGKTSYTVQGMMVSKETSFHNELEVTDYTVTDDGVSVVLKGTVGEQWVTKLEKVMRTYTKADGTPVTAEDFAVKDTFIDLKTKASPDSNFAIFVPGDVSVTVNTAWGDVLHTNLPNAPHGDGDYLVCANKDGQPDLSDVWVVNGAVFPNTYDMSRRPVTAAVTEIEKYGHAVLDVTIADFESRGFQLGDVVTVTAGDFTADMPYLDGYYVDTGAMMLRAYPGKTYIAVCINYGKFYQVAGVDVGSPITITLKEQGGAAALQATYSLKYTNDPADYADDATFANFREVTVGSIAAGKLYRSASPINNENNRAATANKLVEAAGVQAVFNLADTDEELAKYVAAEDFNSAYYAQLIGDGKVIALGMPVNYASDEFAAGIVEGLTFLSEHEGPYLVHCTEGKDRAGFTSALLEALMGASLEEIVTDYMQSYVNYYHLDPVADKDKYDLIAGGNVMEMLRSVAGLEKGADLTGVDLAAAAEAYLTSHGMAETALTALKANLSK